MKKTACLFLLLCLVLTGSTVCFAAPGSVSGWDIGNSQGLVWVTNPSFSGEALTDSYCAVSGYAAQGAVISLYRSNGSGTFDRVAGGVTVGGFEMFVLPVWLNPGWNAMLIRAELWDGRYQQVRCDVNCLGRGLIFAVE